MTETSLSLSPPPNWTGPSSDPNDVQFGDLVDPVDGIDRSILDHDRLTGRLEEYTAVFLGEPFDEAVIGRPGASEGPAAIRQSLTPVKAHVPAVGPIGDRSTAIGDLGDVILESKSENECGGENKGECEGNNSTIGISKTQHTISRLTAICHEASPLPIFLGGDNSLTYPNARPLLETGSLGVITLDAHLDVREIRDQPTSGTPYRQLFEAGLESYACLGARPVETSPTYHEYVRERGGTIVTADAVGDDPKTAAQRALEAMGTVDSVYVSLDMDVLDASAAPGVSAPTPGGITTRELYRLLTLLASDDRIAGFELVECAPPLDRDGMTSDGAARAIAHFLGAYLEGVQ